MNTRVFLPAVSPYTYKDQIKSDRANCFIGRGSSRSSTNAYAKAWGERANKGSYTAKDVVFLSVEGARKGRISFDPTELLKAIHASATIITDVPHHRNRPYNVGEQEAARFLISNGYVETEPGIWEKASDICQNIDCFGNEDCHKADCRAMKETFG